MKKMWIVTYIKNGSFTGTESYEFKRGATAAISAKGQVSHIAKIGRSYVVTLFAR